MLKERLGRLFLEQTIRQLFFFLGSNGMKEEEGEGEEEVGSWADLVEKEEEDRRMFNLTGRDPSRALIIHERLSSPSRTRQVEQ